MADSISSDDVRKELEKQIAAYRSGDYKARIKYYLCAGCD